MTVAPCFSCSASTLLLGTQSYGTQVIPKVPGTLFGDLVQTGVTAKTMAGYKTE